MDPRTQNLQVLARREAQVADDLTSNAQRAAWALWVSFAGWYTASQVRDLAQQSSGISNAGRQAVGNLGIAYIREVLAGLRAARVGQIRLDLPAARLGADLVQVYSRPAEAYRSTYAATEDTTAALAAARTRLDTLVADDMLVARRDGAHQQMVASQVTEYRRIIHPELSKTGVCGLCLAASDHVYSIKTLLPIHDDCWCTVAPITDTYDPGDVNVVDLGVLYTAAGSTSGRDLKKVRFEVNQHGELGPVLTKQGHRFLRQGDAPKGDPIERARKELAALEPVLSSLERRATGGEDITGPLTYQRNRVAKLRAIAGS
jgi:hypothetical protein